MTNSKLQETKAPGQLAKHATKKSYTIREGNIAETDSVLMHGHQVI